ncbi:MAG: hypothetical protein ABL886_05700 [Rhodoglobus sp.]
MNNDLIAKIMEVTPAVARQWLENNYAGNRKRNEKTVAQYAKDMTSGKWPVTGEAIKFSKTGDLIDGQHRLAAIVRANVSVTLLVVVGVESDAYSVLDQGRKRTFGDYLASTDTPYAKLIAATVARVYNYATFRRFENAGYAGHGASLSIPELTSFFEANRGIGAWMSEASLVHTKFRFPPSAVGAVLYVADISGAADVQEFTRQLTLGVGLDESSPVHALRGVLISRLATDSSRRFAIEHYMIQVVKAWNAYAKGEPVKQLKGLIAGQPNVTVFDPHGNIARRWPRRGQSGMN